MSLAHSLCASSSLFEVSELIRQREVSPSEVVEDALNRIGEGESTIRAFTCVTPALARAAARQLDDEWLRGELRSPLHGIPIVYKDNIATAGVSCTANSRSLAQWVPNEDAEVVAQLNQAGSVMVGKATLWELAGAPPTPQSLHPSPRNPWNLDYTAGGSSSGSAAAVAAGFCLGAIGTDTGGSVRNPAASCGLVGCKPTLARVSTQGVIPLSPTLDHVGPITKTVADNLLLLNEMVCRDLLSPVVWPEVMQHPSTLHDLGVRRLRFGVPRHTLERFSHSSVCVEAFEQVLQTLHGLGAEVIDVDLQAWDDISVLGGDITANDAFALYGKQLANAPQNYESSFHARLQRGAALSSERLAELKQARARGLDALANLPEPIDVFITPGAGDTADSFLTMQSPGYGPKADYTRMYNVTGLPALVLPMGLAPDGLPLSLQLASHPYREDLIYRAAFALEDALQFAQCRASSGSPWLARA